MQKLGGRLSLALAVVSVMSCGLDRETVAACAPTGPLLEVRSGMMTDPVPSCDAIEVEYETRCDAESVSWELIGAPTTAVQEIRPGRLSFRAPSVVLPTEVRLRIRARTAAGEATESDLPFRIEAAPPDATLAAGMAYDCAPFRHGVASGDPLPDGVRLWTRVSPPDGVATVDLRWEVASEPRFDSVVATGVAVAEASSDFTVGVDVAGLGPGETWYFRFLDPEGRVSALGRTRTAPVGPTEKVRFAVASCSSIYSGFFHAYRRIAERDDLDGVIHLGDYIYDFADMDEQVRIPSPFPQQPENLAQWRARHEYYLADPDLRLARARHPWIQIWDNHDVERSALPDYQGSVQAFREWNPLRADPSGLPERNYRRLSYGSLVDIVLVDSLLFRDRELVPGTSESSMLGSEQFEWLEGALRSSTATWRLFGSQKVFGTVRINPDFAQQYDGGRREIFDPSSWDGYPAERRRVIGLLGERGDNVVLSGDSHVSLAMDVVDSPASPRYDPARPEGRSAGVELLPTSISRGNFDEALGPDAPSWLFDLLVSDTRRRNPHHRYLELTRHGYGIVDVTTEKVTAEIWYSEILDPLVEAETLGVRLEAFRGENRWDRSTPAPSPTATPGPV